MKRFILLSLVSFAFFFANGQALQLQHPAKGDVWTAYTTQKIQWHFANVDNIKIEFSTDSARTWTVLQSSYPASATFYDWTVPAKPSDSCFVRISDVSNPSVQSSNFPGSPFTIPRPTLVIDNVNPVVYGKTALPISWSSAGVQKIRLLVSYNNFASYSLIADNIPASQGLYNWLIKDTSATNCLIVIQSADSYYLADTIDQSFFIQQLPKVNEYKYTGGSYDGHSSATNKGKSKGLRLLTPNKREIIVPNTIYPITWSSKDINQVSIKYSIDSGKSWLTIDTAVSAALAKFNWTVPATPSTTCLIRIADASDASIYDISDSAFTISTNSLRLNTPVENETVFKGQAMQISWASTGVSKINISYKDGSSWKIVSNGVNATNEVFNWVVPADISDSISLKISGYDNSSLVDSTTKIYVRTMPSISATKYKGGSYDGHSFATNKGPSLTLTNPNGNNKIASAITYNITWASSVVAKTDIALSIDSGHTWQTVVSSYPSTGLYVWTVPGITSTKCLIKITNSDDLNLFDISDSVFTILPKSIDLVIDSVGTKYVGTALPLQWTQTGIEKVSLNYKVSKNGSWQKIKSFMPSASEVYNWVLPSFATDSVWIRAFDSEDSAVGDEQLFIGLFKTLPAAVNTKFTGGSFDGHSFRSTFNKISIFKPAANDTLVSGSTYPIRWKSGNVTDSIMLQYSLDSGRTWMSISAFSATVQQYNWIVPSGSFQNLNIPGAPNSNILSDQCIIRALEISSGNEIVGLTSKTFSIVEGGTLPVSILSFNGKYAASKVMLAWVAANEISLSHYEVERSVDGTSYTKVGEVKAGSVNYKFADDVKDLQGQKVLYRLKKVDNDNRYSYTTVLTFKMPDNISFDVYPNPAKSYISLRLSSNVRGLVNVQLSDVWGRVVQQKTVDVNSTSVTFDSNELSNGTYIIRFVYKGEEYLKKVIVAR